MNAYHSQFDELQKWSALQSLSIIIIYRYTRIARELEDGHEIDWASPLKVVVIMLQKIQQL